MAEAVRVTCGGCGSEIKASPRYFGKTVKCPGCAHPVTVPAPIEEPAFLDDAAFDDENVETAKDDLDDFDRSFGHASASLRTATNDENVESPSRRRPGQDSRSGLIAGLVMMVIAVVWFVGALYAGFIEFYPPVLFIIGLVAFVRGLFGD